MSVVYVADIWRISHTSLVDPRVGCLSPDKVDVGIKGRIIMCTSFFSRFAVPSYANPPGFEMRLKRTAADSGPINQQ